MDELSLRWNTFRFIRIRSAINAVDIKDLRRFVSDLSDTEIRSLFISKLDPFLPTKTLPYSYNHDETCVNNDSNIDYDSSSDDLSSELSDYDPFGNDTDTVTNDGDAPIDDNCNLTNIGDSNERLVKEMYSLPSQSNSVDCTVTNQIHISMTDANLFTKMENNFVNYFWRKRDETLTKQTNIVSKRNFHSLPIDIINVILGWNTIGENRSKIGVLNWFFYDIIQSQRNNQRLTIDLSLLQSMSRKYADLRKLGRNVGNLRMDVTNRFESNGSQYLNLLRYTIANSPHLHSVTILSTDDLPTLERFGPLPSVRNVTVREFGYGYNRSRLQLSLRCIFPNMEVLSTGDDAKLRLLRDINETISNYRPQQSHHSIITVPTMKTLQRWIVNIHSNTLSCAILECVLKICECRTALFNGDTLMQWGLIDTLCHNFRYRSDSYLIMLSAQILNQCLIVAHSEPSQKSANIVTSTLINGGIVTHLKRMVLSNELNKTANECIIKMLSKWFPGDDNDRQA